MMTPRQIGAVDNAPLRSPGRTVPAIPDSRLIAQHPSPTCTQLTCTPAPPTRLSLPDRPCSTPRTPPTPNGSGAAHHRQPAHPAKPGSASPPVKHNHKETRNQPLTGSVPLATQASSLVVRHDPYRGRQFGLDATAISPSRQAPAMSPRGYRQFLQVAFEDLLKMPHKQPLGGDHQFNSRRDSPSLGQGET